MPAKSKGPAGDGVREVLRGGKKVPQGLMRRHMADLMRNLEARFKEKSALQQQARKYLSQIQKPATKPAPQSAEVTRAMDGLRKMTERLANRKLARPARPTVGPGMLTGSYSLQMTPPYDYASHDTSIGFGDPKLSASVDVDSGEMSDSVVSNFDTKSSGQACSAIGIYFYPMFQSGGLRVTANPSFVFSWWANSLYSSIMTLPADSIASGSFGITAYRGNVAVGQSMQDFTLWQEFVGDDLQFDFGSTTRSLSAQMDVDSGHSYVISLACTCFANAGGWPGSLAGATINATLPSITLDVQGAVPLPMP